MVAISKDSRTFGKNLRLERNRLGLSQGALADIGGVSKATQAAYEGDSTRPDIDYLSRVSEAGVDILWVATGRRAADVDWPLLDEVMDLIEEWADARGKRTTLSDLRDLLGVFYSHFRHYGCVFPADAGAAFGLVK
jgi:transcriptional regulator with XRE-family HTH domain